MNKCAQASVEVVALGCAVFQGTGAAAQRARAQSRNRVGYANDAGHERDGG